MINVKIANLDRKCLIDTGASVSCISQSLLNRLKPAQNSNITKSAYNQVFGVGGEILKITGCITLRFKISEQEFEHKFLIFNRLHHSLILGVDFLQRNKCTIDYESNSLTSSTGKPIISFCTTSSDLNFNLGLARSVENVTIAPFHAALVPIRLSKVPNNLPVLLEPVVNLASTHSLAGARSVITSVNHRAYFKILNPMPHKANIRKGQVIGKLHSIDNMYSIDDDENKQSPFVNATSTETKLTDEDYIQIVKQLEIPFDSCMLSEAQKRKLKVFLGKNSDVFAKSSSDIGCTDLYFHRIETGDNPPFRQKPYRQSPKNQQIIQEHVQQMLKDNIIIESNSTWAAPVVLVSKKNTNEMRFAVDYRGLNARSQAINFPIPDLQDALDSVGTAQSKVFSVMDLKSSFWQIPLHPETADRTAFITHDGCYQFTRVPYGIQNGSMAFQMLMSRVLRNINFKFALVFIDDILCHSSTFEQHLEHLSAIFQRLRNSNLKLNPKKCQFAAQRVEYLGHIMSDKGIQANPDKTDIVKNFPRPRNRKEVKSFLGLCNFYRRYVKGYADIVNPLNQLLKKENIPLKWTAACEKAFNDLKDKLTSPPILAFPNLNKSFRIAVDASDYAIGYILSQFDDNKQERVIAYGGRSLRGTERKWSVTEKEGLALVEAVKTYHSYLANTEFEVFTDHISLTWLRNIKLASGRLARWSLRLQEYKFKITHRPGLRNQNADTLSRKHYAHAETEQNPDDTENDTEIIANVEAMPIVNANQENVATNVINQSENATQNTQQNDSETHDYAQAYSSKEYVMVQFEYESQNTNLNVSALSTDDETLVLRPDSMPKVEGESNQSLSQLQWECKELSPYLQYLVHGTLPQDDNKARKLVFESENYIVVDDILYHYTSVRSRGVPKPMHLIRQLAVPSQLREDVLLCYHDGPGGSHFGFDKTYSSIKAKYYWPNMYRDIENHIKSCDACQKASRAYHKRKAPLVPFSVEAPFSRLHMDILGPLPPSSYPHAPSVEYKYILLVVDSFTGWCEAFPIVSQDAKTVAFVLYSEIFCRYSSPDCIISDQGSNFMSQLVQALCELFQVARHRTSAYKPNCNGRAEVMNTSIGKSLRAYCDGNQEKWVTYLPGILLGLRLAVNSTTQQSPFFLMFGRQMRTPLDNALLPKAHLGQTVKDFLEDVQSSLKQANQIARENTTKAKQKQKQYYDKNAEEPNFAVGQKVLLEVCKSDPGKSRKLTNKFEGPYQITRLGPNYTYYLKNLSDNKEHDKPYASIHLKTYFDETIRTTPKPSGQPAIQKAQPRKQNEVDQHYYAVDKIMGAKQSQGRTVYKIKWKDCSQTSWEPEENVHPELLHEYLKTHTKSGKPRKKVNPNKYFKTI